jgi:hypothetical protein
VKGLQFLYPIQADPSVQKRNERDGLSYKDYFYKLSGVYLTPGNNDIMYGIEKVRDYMVSHKLFFFNNLDNLKYEAKSYIFNKSDKHNTNEKPMDKHNHLMDAMRYMVAVFPQDPNDMGSIYLKESLSRPVTVFTESSQDNNEDALQYGRSPIYRGLKI